MLAYHSITSALHSTLRDSLEISLATMFLKGHVDRDRDDWMDLALRYGSRTGQDMFVQGISLTFVACHCMKSIRVRSGW